jgi:hypothetical protein
MENSPEQLATLFLSHFIDVPMEELENLEITRALSALFAKIAEETMEAIQEFDIDITGRTLH